MIKAKHTFIFFLFIISYIPYNNVYAQEKVQWLSVQEAINQSEIDGKPIFVDVYTDWCYWCKVMDKKTFTNDEVVSYVSGNFHAAKLNPEKEGLVTYRGEEFSYREFANKFSVRGYPTILLLHSKEKGQASAGFRDPKPFIDMLEKYKNKCN